MTTKYGVYVGNNAADLNQFEGWLGQHVDTVLGYTGGGGWGDADPGWQLSTDYLGGTGRQINWSIPMTPDASGVQGMREAAAGQHNADYTHWAQEILASRGGDNEAIYVRTAWELGGEWFHWTNEAQEDPQAFIGAFQQFAQSFHEVSDRFKIVWDVAADRGAVEKWYPGDHAVDVVSQDVYWNPQWIGNEPNAAFDAVVNGKERGLAWVADFAAAHGKEIAIPEWGVPGSNSGVDGAKWIELMKGWIDSHDVAFANYWNGLQETGYDGKLSDGDPAASAAALRGMYAAGDTSAPEPAPTPDPHPAPAPVPVPSPDPIPEPDPVPQPDPEPQPDPAPEPQPEPPAPTPDPEPNRLSVEGSAGRDIIRLNHAFHVDVDAGAGKDKIVLRADHGDVHIILDAGETKGDVVKGFNSGAGDILEFHGFGAGHIKELGHGDFKVIGENGHGERFHLDGVDHLATSDYIFA